MTTLKTTLSVIALCTLSCLLIASAPKAEADTLMQPAASSTGFVLTGTSSAPEASSTVYWPAIKAASAIVYDPIRGRVIYEKDADTVRPIASLTKLMTASVADTIMNWTDALSNTPIRVLAMKDEDQADVSLKNGTRWMPRDLLKYMLIGSSNKASETIASALVDRSVFVSLMNYYAKQWGLIRTGFSNPSGLNVASIPANVQPTAETSGGVSTAREVALMMWHIIEIHDDLLDPTRAQAASFSAGHGNVITIKNTDEALADQKLGSLPIVFGKTGFTSLAGGNLAVMMQKNPQSNPYIVVVLGSTVTDRYADVASLASMAQSLVSYQK